MKALLLVSMAILLSACQTTSTVRNRLVQAFDEAVFYVAPDQSGQKVVQKNNHLTRWEKPILARIDIDGAGGEDLRAHFTKVLANFTPQLPVPFTLVDAKSGIEANLIIKVPDAEAFTINSNERAACYAHVRANKDGGVSTVEIVLPGKRLEMAKECFAHELMHGIGFRGHTHSINSALSYVPPQEQLTQWDIILVKLLYHPELDAGMDRQTTLAKASELIGGLYK